MLRKTMKLTHSVVDLGAQRTALKHLENPALSTALPLDDPDHFRDLQRQASQSAIPVAALTQEKPEVLGKLAPGFGTEKYWRTLFSAVSPELYAESCWKLAVPLEAGLDPDHYLNLHLTAFPRLRCRPRPCVRLYPFGWTLWLSVKIVGLHSLDELADLVEALLENRVYRVKSHRGEPLDFTSFADLVAEGVRKDAFLGNKTDDREVPFDVTSVVTVLVKDGGSPSLGALVPAIAKPLGRLVRLHGTATSERLLSVAGTLEKGGDDDLNYVLQNNMHVFIWAEHLLAQQSALCRHLRCYHNNTFRALDQARHAQRFLENALHLKKKKWPLKLAELVGHAADFLDLADGGERYRSRTAVAFREREEVLAVVAKARARLGQ